MLWNIIRDFFVQYVFGGLTSTGAYFGGTLGTFITSTDASFDDNFDGSFYIPIKGFVDNDYTGIAEYIRLSDWLSTTATIITLCLLVAFLFLVVRWLFKLVSGLITLRG